MIPGIGGGGFTGGAANSQTGSGGTIGGVQFGGINNGTRGLSPLMIAGLIAGAIVIVFILKK